MKPPRCPRPLVVLLVPCLGYAADAPAPAAKKSPPPETRRTGGGAVSSHISEAIKAQLPVFQPASPPPAPPADLAGSETSGHPIIMETVIVAERKKVPEMSEFSMLTKEGQRAYLQKRFPGATPPGGDPLGNLTRNYAAGMLRDEIRLAHLEKLTDLAETFRRGGDPVMSKRVKEEMQRALIRPHDWQTEALDRSYNNDRR